MTEVTPPTSRPPMPGAPKKRKRALDDICIATDDFLEAISDAEVMDQRLRGEMWGHLSMTQEDIYDLQFALRQRNAVQIAAGRDPITIRFHKRLFFVYEDINEYNDPELVYTETERRTGGASIPVKIIPTVSFTLHSSAYDRLGADDVRDLVQFFKPHFRQPDCAHDLIDYLAENKEILNHEYAVRMKPGPIADVSTVE